MGARMFMANKVGETGGGRKVLVSTADLYWRKFEIHTSTTK